MNLDWKSIRSLNGGQDKAFEELCAQLAHTTIPNGAKFVRKGTPDAGVECYAILKDDTEWGWQAKYFDTLGDTQWSQVNKSVIKALEKHPNLVRYYVCIPIDRPDGRIVNQKSAMQKWNGYVDKWEKLATAQQMNVEFIYWGSHELLNHLSKPEHQGRIHFWFDSQEFSSDWFCKKIQTAISTAGPRYTPEVNIDLPIAYNFEAFGRTKEFFEREKTHTREIRKKFKKLNIFSTKDIDETILRELRKITDEVQAILDCMYSIEYQPSGILPFKVIIDKILSFENNFGEFIETLNEYERNFTQDKNPQYDELTHLSRIENPYRTLKSNFYRLLEELKETCTALEQADKIANNNILILQGNAGTGKTHLLCDVAKTRIKNGNPTILLMGQQYLNNNTPWLQTLSHLDLANISNETFIGALETAAQTANSRALIMIDAINEGQGRTLWPNHLAAFLDQVNSSPWIGVVLSIRSSYEDIVIPEIVRDKAVIITHEGFSSAEYDAAKTFFAYYGIELPSTPLLTPEFRNPLFLKTLCKGLQAKNLHRLPRGYQGISAIFNFFLSAINDRLAKLLDFDKQTLKVSNSIEAYIQAIISAENSWLSLDKTKEIINSFLPNRDYERSLYRGLLTEGLLIEDVHQNQTTEIVVYLAYERLADHLTVKFLLDKHLDKDNPTAAFKQDGELSFLSDRNKYISPGQLEAFCIQVPERTGRELPSIAPKCKERYILGDSFRQSIIWRALEAFSDDTPKILNELITNVNEGDDTLDILLTVATIPEHPFNAQFLDHRLRKDNMPDRDAWWSIYLHRRWDTNSPIAKLVDWASDIESNHKIPDETLNLFAITLSWMFTTSNRFLRDHATKALVSLLTNRLAAMSRLIDWVNTVDDLYVKERVYAVAYGVAMRSHDSTEVEILAKKVYEIFFALNKPIPHILLRDYARGIVERALFLNTGISVDTELIRPPYNSEFPTIPTEEEIQPFLPNWEKGSHDSGELEWARNRIGFSVLGDDFARYVIGTNSSKTSRHWLSLKINDPIWTQPKNPQEQLQFLTNDFSPKERDAWDKLQETNSTHLLLERYGNLGWNWDNQEDVNFFEENPNNSESYDSNTTILNTSGSENVTNSALKEFKQTLSQEHLQLYEKYLSQKKSFDEREEPPRLELRQIQRYILWRVFNLGWTIERFGWFDRNYIGSQGREASKVERIGKKYQWISYHEILAFISDQYQYHEIYQDEGDKDYEGPWQDYWRDIDPSCTIRKLRGGTGWESHTPAWWAPTLYNSWEEPNNPKKWVLELENLPSIEELLITQNRKDNSNWLNGQGYFTWRQQAPPDRESINVERREFWCSFSGYLIKKSDSKQYVEWARSVDNISRSLPEVPQVYQMFLGEYGWAEAYLYFKNLYEVDSQWTPGDNDCPIETRPLSFKYVTEDKGFDCSIEEGFVLRLPNSELITGLGVQWNGIGVDFVNNQNETIIQDPTFHEDGPSSLLIRKEPLYEFLQQNDLTICWSVMGEKLILPAGLGSGPYPQRLRLSGAYVLSEEKINGFIKYFIEQENGNEKLLETISNS